jgi:hypothetical protein
MIRHVPVASCQPQVDAPTTPVAQPAPLEALAHEAMKQVPDAPPALGLEEEPVSDAPISAAYTHKRCLLFAAWWQITYVAIEA